MKSFKSKVYLYCQRPCQQQSLTLWYVQKKIQDKHCNRLIKCMFFLEP
jgi:hypothetical protein